MARALTVLLALVAFLAAGCGSGGDAGGVRFLTFGDPEELEAYRALIAAYEERVGENVQLIEASDRQDLLARLSTGFAGGVPPDVFLVNYRFYGQFAARGVLAPVADRVAASSAFRETDFYPQALDAFRWRGVLTCLPQNVSSLVVYWNRTLFRRFGVPEPRAGWSWAEFASTAAQLTRDAAGVPVRAIEPDRAGGVRPAIYGLGIEASLIRLAPFVWSNGGEIVDDPARPTRLALERPAALDALRQLLELRTFGVIPTDEEVEAEDDESRFANGRLAMLLQSRRATPTFRTISDFEWDVAPLPTLRAPAGILHSDAYCLARASKRLDAAWRFVEFASSAEGQRIVARTGRTVPSLIAVSRSPAFLDPASPPASAQVFLDAIPSIRRVPTLSTWPEIEDAVEPILENGLYGGVRAEEIARQLDDATRPLFARADRP